MQRLVNATKIKNVNTIIQLTGDNPFIDPLIIDYIVEFFIKNYPKYDYVTNNNLFDKKPMMISPIIIKSSIEKIYAMTFSSQKTTVRSNPDICYSTTPPIRRDH